MAWAVGRAGRLGGFATWRAAGGGVTGSQWETRHVVVLSSLLVFLPVITLMSVANALALDLVSTYLLVLVLLAVLALSPKVAQPVRQTFAAGAVLTATVALIEASDKAVGAHLVFGFAVVLLTLYQSWPLLFATWGYVLLYYLGLAAIDPTATFAASVPAEVAAQWPPMFAGAALLASLPGVLFWVLGDSAARETEMLQVALAEAALRERQASELNDTVMQDLVTALYALEEGERDDAVEAARRAVTSARRIVDSLLIDSGSTVPGSLVRDEPAQNASDTVGGDQ